MSLVNMQGYIDILLILLFLSPTTGVDLLPFGPNAGDLEWAEAEEGEYFNVTFSKQDFLFNGILRNFIAVSIFHIFFFSTTLCGFC